MPLKIFPWTHLIQAYHSVNSSTDEKNKKPSQQLDTSFTGSFWWSTLIGCHLAHTTDFIVALICYLYFFPVEKAKEFRLDWILTVLIYNLSVEFILFGGWHMIMYGPFKQKIWDQKFNQEDQYHQTGNLKREITFTTLGFLQSSLYQIVIMHLLASNKISWYSDFWTFPLSSIFWLLFATYWREFHFYWVHRMIHPWNIYFPVIGDPGKFLYLNFHKLHHLSYNPGPFSGLSMHPVEHFIYYTCTLLPLYLGQHPLHFLYTKFHADIAPIGGHDGYANPPGGGADYHYLHHARFECNYGVPLINFDKLFGTWADYETRMNTSPNLNSKANRNMRKKK